MKIRIKAFGEEHPNIASCLNGLGDLYRSQERYEEAESHYKRALFMWEKTLGENHPFVALSLTGLASVYQNREDFERSEPYFKRALMIREKVFGDSHELTLEVRSSLDELSKNLNSK